ncbi:MAG: OsmC family protein [Bacteroidia bacterium]|jgi:putative redox protein
MVTVKGSIGKNHYKTSLSAETNHLFADEPVSNGGEALGFSPSELLSAALTACTCITLRMYSDKKSWPLEDVKVTIDFSRDNVSNTSSINRTVELVGPLSEEQKQRLLQIANQCFIHKTLTSPIHIQTSLA